MKKTKPASIIFIIFIIGLFIFTLPVLDSCSGECEHNNDTVSCDDSTMAVHKCNHEKEHKCDHNKNDSINCQHNHKNHHCNDLSNMKDERIAFNEVLTGEEKAEIERIKAIFAKIDHETTNCEEVQKKYADEIASLQSIVDLHSDDFIPVCEKRHSDNENHKCNDMTDEEKAEHCNHFKLHFLLMDFE